MAGMHRDKCGAAFVAGFFQVSLVFKSVVNYYHYGIVHHCHLCFNGHFPGKPASAGLLFSSFSCFEREPREVRDAGFDGPEL